MHSPLQCQHASAHMQLPSRICQQYVCRCGVEEQTIRHRFLQRPCYTPDIIAPISNNIISTGDHAATRTAACRVAHTLPHQPPALQNQTGPFVQQAVEHQMQLQPPHQQAASHLTGWPLEQQPSAPMPWPAQSISNANNGPSSRSADGENADQAHQQLRKPARSHRRAHSQTLLKLKPCGRGGTLKQAITISKCLQQGQQILLPAGSGLQLARGVAAVASARTLMLGHSSKTGLVFQPSFPAAATADGNTGQQQHLQDDVSSSSSTSKSSKASDTSIMMYVASLPEAQLRRFEQQPLIAARYGSIPKLAAAAFARVCQQGYTAVRAAGPDAVAVALHAVTHARRKLLGCGLDIAVLPTTEFVDVESLAEPDSQQFVEYDGSEQLDNGMGDEGSKQYVRITVLHVMRCEAQQPQKLLPWQPQPEQMPAVRWQQQRLEQQQLAWQQQQQLHEQEMHAQHLQDSSSTDSLHEQSVPSSWREAYSSSDSSRTDNSDTSQVNDSDGSLWDSTAIQGCHYDEVEVLQHSHASGVVARQSAAVLLQKQRKANRQLVAAAQAGGHSSNGGCSKRS